METDVGLKRPGPELIEGQFAIISSACTYPPPCHPFCFWFLNRHTSAAQVALRKRGRARGGDVTEGRLTRVRFIPSLHPRPRPRPRPRPLALAPRPHPVTHAHFAPPLPSVQEPPKIEQKLPFGVNPVRNGAAGWPRLGPCLPLRPPPSLLHHISCWAPLLLLTFILPFRCHRRISRVVHGTTQAPGTMGAMPTARTQW